MTPGHERNLLLIVSGPAGSGKTTLCDRMLAEEPAVQRVVTSTTRPPREGEEHGRDYYFFSAEAFEERVAAGAFYEHATVHTNRYGTLKSEIRDKLDAGADLLLNIDVQGAAAFREAAADDPALGGRLATVFIRPPSFKELELRLRERGTDDDDEIRRRLAVAEREVREWDRYDYCLTSASRGEDFDRLHAIYIAEKLRVRP